MCASSASASRDERGQRRAQLVRDVGGEPPLSFLRRGERRDLRVERLRHLVERARPGAELVLPLDRQPCLQKSLGQRARCVAGACNGRQRATSDERACSGGEEHEQQRAADEDVPQVGELAPQLVLGEEEVEVDVRSGHASPDEDVARAPDVDALVRQLAVLDELLDVVRHLIRAERDARREGLPSAHADGVEEAAQLERLQQGVRVVADVLREHEVEARLVERALGRVVEPRLAHHRIRADRERERGEPADEREGHGEATTEPHPSIPDRAGSRRRARSGSASAHAGRPRSSRVVAARRRRRDGSRRGSRSSRRARAGARA